MAPYPRRSPITRPPIQLETMRSRFLLTCIVAAALLAAARAADSTEDEDDVQVSSVPAGMETATPEPTPEEPITAVLELTDENFDDVISGDVPVLVQLFVSDDGYCPPQP